MGWFQYYKLLEDHDGDLSKASKEELEWAARGNPNNPADARKLAETKYDLDKKARVRENPGREDIKMNRIEGPNISETEQESNTLIKRMMKITKLINEIDDDDEILKRASDFLELVGDAKITVGVMPRYGTKIKTYIFTNNGVTIHEESIRSRTVDCIKRNS